MRVFIITVIAVLAFVVAGFNLAVAEGKGVCLKVSGEKIEIQNLADDPVVFDRDGLPDFISTTMSKSISTATETKDYNLVLSGVKRDDKKSITLFDVKIDEKAYSYPKDSCEK